MRIFLIALLLVAGASAVIAQNDPKLFIQDVSWAPDGKSVAYTGLHDIDQKANTLNADVYVISVDGGGPKKITGDDKNRYYTSWAKGRIAFSAGDAGGKHSEIFHLQTGWFGCSTVDPRRRSKFDARLFQRRKTDSLCLNAGRRQTSDLHNQF
jgi:hypothetical protein